MLKFLHIGRVKLSDNLSQAGGLLSASEDHTFHCQAVSYPVDETTVKMAFRKCGDEADGDSSNNAFLTCAAREDFPLPLNPISEHVRESEAAFLGDWSVTLATASGWSNGVVSCEACNELGCDSGSAAFIVGDLPGI